LTPEPAIEPTSQAAILAEVCQHAARLLSGMDAQPRSLSVQVGDVAVDIEWPEPQPHGAHRRLVDIATTEVAIPVPDAAAATPWRALIPAFMVGELRRAFEMGFLLYLPFIVIDLVVASVLMSLGMMMLPPNAVALPFKLIFFVLVDGWRLVAGSLVQSFAPHS